MQSVATWGHLAAEHGHRSPNLAKEVPVLCITPVKAVFGSVSILLSATKHLKFIRSQDAMISKLTYVKLGLAWTDARATLIVR